jgi:hypothetical protein
MKLKRFVQSRTRSDIMDHLYHNSLGQDGLEGITDLLRRLSRIQLVASGLAYREADVSRLHRRAYSILLGFDDASFPTVRRS